ncbi:MAG: hypothetical protein Q9220_002694 [cf. Caloplaca sp. 1 TL-2023]
MRLLVLASFLLTFFSLASALTIPNFGNLIRRTPDFNALLLERAGPVGSGAAASEGASAAADDAAARAQYGTGTKTTSDTEDEEQHPPEAGDGSTSAGTTIMPGISSLCAFAGFATLLLSGAL